MAPTTFTGWAALALVPALATLAPAPRATEDALQERLDHLAGGVIETQGLDALTVGIDLGGEQVGTWGWAGAASPDARALPAGGALDLILSAAALASDRGEGLKLDTPLSERLPELGALAEGRTILHLLQHTSGLPDYTDALADGRPEDPAAALAGLAELAAVADPGHCFGWTSTDALALGLALSRAHEKSVRELALETVLEPLDLDGTWSDAARQRMDGLLSSGIDTGGTGRAAGRDADLFRASDLRLDPAQLLTLWAGYRDGDLFGPAHARLAFTAVDEGHGAGGTHGLAVHQVRLGELEGWIAGGRLGDSHVSLAWYPEIELAVAVAGTGRGADLPAVGRSVARAVLDWPEPDTVDLPLGIERAAAYIGGYSVGCSRVEIVMRGDRLVMARAEGDADLAYQGGHVFAALDDPDLRLRFEPPREGLSPGFVLDDHGSVVVATRFD